jgi:type VI secretion system secreted protein VgrG
MASTWWSPPSTPSRRARGDGSHGVYRNKLTCARADVTVRPARIHGKPVIPGLLTATVVGPEEQEIHTDVHGRIRVQFHWDRLGARNEHSSCFVRVVQPWAGEGWGFVFIPRIGMEVTVMFVEGDPDRPIVTGTVYNGANRTPYTLPDDMTRSVIRTRSTPSSGSDWGYNELRFEDKAGGEEVFLRAEKDLTELVKNDHLTQVNGNQSNFVVGVHTVAIGMERSVTVGMSETITIGASRTETVEGAEGDPAARRAGTWTWWAATSWWSTTRAPSRWRGRSRDATWPGARCTWSRGTQRR